MKFRRVSETEAQQYVVGGPLPPGAICENGRVYIQPGRAVYQDVGPPELMQITLKGGEWIRRTVGTYAEILDLKEWKQIIFAVTINGESKVIERSILRFGELCELLGFHANFATISLAGKHWVFYPGEQLQMSDGLVIEARP